METPLVSILTTLFNREKFIQYCIESVLNSTFQNLELIIVDDGSTDSSLEIAYGYAKKDNRIKVFQNKTNLGDYPNRNKAASYANGKYIKYLDADDLLYPHSIELMASAMEKFPEAALGISEFVNEDFDPYPFMVSSHETYIREFLKQGILGVGPSATIIRREAFEKSGCFSGKRYVGDTELWLKLAASYPIVKMQSGLIFWRRHAGQEFDLGHTTNSYLVMNYQMNIKALSNNNCPLTLNEKELAIRKLNYRQGRNIINLALKKRKPLKALQVIKESGYTFSNLIKSLLPFKI
jgi:glycosyltransferase involved in cell wall biosynthesis